MQLCVRVLMECGMFKSETSWTHLQDSHPDSEPDPDSNQDPDPNPDPDSEVLPLALTKWDQPVKRRAQAIALT